MCHESRIHGPDLALSYSKLKFNAGLVQDGLDIPQWLILHKGLREHGGERANKFNLMLWLSALAAYKHTDISVVQTLALMFTSSSSWEIPLPNIESFRPQEGYQATRQSIRNSVNAHSVTLGNSPEGRLSTNQGENWRAFQTRRDLLFHQNRASDVDAFVELLFNQWSTRSPAAGRLSNYIRVDEMMVEVKAKFNTWYDNLQLFNYFCSIDEALVQCNPHQIPKPLWVRVGAPITLSRPCFISSGDLFKSTAPSVPQGPISTPEATSAMSISQQLPRLRQLIEKLTTTSRTSKYEARYVNELRTSLESLEALDVSHTPDVLDQLAIFKDHLCACNRHFDDIVDNMIRAANSAPETTHGLVTSSTVHQAQQWPRISVIFLLSHLSRACWARLSPGWRNCIVQFGLSIAAVQRARRLVKAAESRNMEDLIQELENVGHTNWNPLDCPESLLLEVENSITIRPVQEDIAAQMRAPSGPNKVMQLNMGEGKSSVIVPMVAASLANSTQLIRVLVAKPQSKQMAEMLKSKLGGLINRRIDYLPFSRALKISAGEAEDIGEIMHECMEQGGILLILPEHILSFKLMGLECFNSEKCGTGASLLRTQDFFDVFLRDIGKSFLSWLDGSELIISQWTNPTRFSAPSSS